MSLVWCTIAESLNNCYHYYHCYDYDLASNFWDTLILSPRLSAIPWNGK